MCSNVLGSEQVVRSSQRAGSQLRLDCRPPRASDAIAARRLLRLRQTESSKRPPLLPRPSRQRSAHCGWLAFQSPATRCKTRAVKNQLQWRCDVSTCRRWKLFRRLFRSANQLLIHHGLSSIVPRNRSDTAGHQCMLRTILTDSTALHQPGAECALPCPTPTDDTR